MSGSYVWRLVMAACLAAVVSSNVQAAVQNGDGTMTVTPSNSVAVGSTGNSFTFAYRNENGGAFTAGSQLTLQIPAGWTAPQSTNASGAGYLSLSAVGAGSTASITNITGTGPWTITISMVVPQGTGFGFNLLYAGGGSAVTAPTAAGVHTFAALTAKSGGTLTGIAVSPSITVAPGPAVGLGIGYVSNGRGAWPFVNYAFQAAVQAQDTYGNGVAVTNNTDVYLSLSAGTGNLGGITNGTIAAGASSITITGLMYDVAETGVVLVVTRTSGDPLPPGTSAPFIVRESDPDLPGALPNFENISAGAYIIPMDTNRQNLGVSTVFNLKAYGLVSMLLHSNVPVKWAIAAGKVKDAPDFSASVRRLLPGTNGTAVLPFYSGPFIVEDVYTNLAMPIIRSYSNMVAVYQLLSNATIDVRYTLTHKPKVAVFDDGGTQHIHYDILTEAGFTTNDWRVLHAADIGFIGATSCFTFASSPHFDGGGTASNQAVAVNEFVESGGNFLAQCAGVRTYENEVDARFHSTLGFVDMNDATSFIYPNPDMPFGQYQGPLTDQGGSLQDWGLASGSVWTNDAYILVQNSAATNAASPKTNSFRAGVAKHNNGSIGSLVFYLGGHSYDVGGNVLGDINGQRMYLNAIFVPPDRPGVCGITFNTDLELTKAANTNKPDLFGNVIYTLTVTNKGPANATGVTVKDLLPAGLNYVSSTGGTYAASNGIWIIGNLPYKGTASLQITAVVTNSGFITNVAQVWTSDQGDKDSTPGNWPSNPASTNEDDFGMVVVGSPIADLALSKTGPAYAQVGSFANFTLVLTNKGADTATGVTVQDVLPPGLGFVSSSNGAYNAPNGIWTVGTLPVHASTSLVIRVQVLVGGAQTNMAQVWTSDLHDTNSTPANSVPTEDDQSSVVLTGVTPAIGIVKTADNTADGGTDYVTNGQWVTYHYAITNSGDVTLTNVVVSDDKIGLVASNLTLSPGSWTNVSAMARLTNDTVNWGTVTGQPNVPANAVAASNDAVVDVVRPEIGIVKIQTSPAGRPSAVGETNVFVIVVTNRGDVLLTNVVVSDAYDSGKLIYVSATPSPVNGAANPLIWTSFPVLGVGQSAIITTRFVAATSGQGTNWVTAQADTQLGLPVPPATTNAIHVAVSPNVAIDKVRVNPTGRPSAVGETNVFTITVSNTGDYPLGTVPVVDTYDATLLNYVSATPAPTNAVANGSLTWTNVGPLGVGQSTVITSRFVAVKSGTGTNVVVTAPTTTNGVPVPPASDEEPHSTVPDALLVTKQLISPAGRPAAIGETNVFLITVMNVSSAPVLVVPLEDRYETNLLGFLSATPTETAQVPGALTWAQLGPLGVGGSTSVTTRFLALTNGIGTNVVIAGTSTNNVPYTNANPRVGIDKVLVSPTGRPSAVGETNVFTITVSNTGDYPLGKVPVEDTYDATLLNYVSATPAPTNAVANGSLTWTNVGPLGVGQSTVITSRFVAVKSGTGTNVVVTAPMTTNGVPVPPASDREPHTAVPDTLLVTKQLIAPAGRPAVIGETNEFLIMVTNLSVAPVLTVPLEDRYETNLLSFLSATPVETSQSAGVLTWVQLGPLGVGGSTSVTTRFLALTNGIGTNIVITTTSTNDVPYTNTNPRVGIDKVLVSPTGRPSAVGETNVFTITVSNTGDYPLGKVPVEDTYDATLLNYVSATPAPTNAVANGSLTWTNVGPLGVGQSTVITVRFAAARSGAGTNVVVTAPTTTNGVPVPPASDREPHNAVPDALQVVKQWISPAGRPAAIGETNVFLITVTNLSVAPVLTVPLEDRYETNLLSFLSATPTETAQVPGVVTWAQLGPLGVGGSTSVTTRFLALTNGIGTNVVITTTSTNDVPYTNVNPRITLVKLAGNAPDGAVLYVRPGSNVVYTYRVTNAGDAMLYNVAVTDNVLGAVGFLAGPFMPGASVTFTATHVNVMADVTNIGTVTGDAGTGGHTVSAKDDAVVQMAYLMVEKEDLPDPVHAGMPLTYTLWIANPSPHEVTGVVVTEQYPAWFKYGGANPAPTLSNNVWNLWALPAGALQPIVIHGTVLASAVSGGQLTNLVTVTSSNAGTIVTNEITRVTDDPGPGKTEIHVTKRDDADPIQAGSNLVYTLRVENFGPLTATNVVVTETYDAKFMFVGAVPAPDVGTSNVWTLGNLAPNAVVEIAVTGRVSASAPNGYLVVDRVVATASNASPSEDEEITLVGVPPPPVVNKTVAPPLVLAGHSMVYTITVANVSALVVSNVTVVESFDPGFVYGSAVPAPVAGTSNEWDLGNLSAFSSVTIVISGLASTNAQPVDVLFNTAEVISDGGSRTVHATNTVYQPASIGDRLWADFNVNGIYDESSNSVVVAGLPVQLYTASNVLVAATNTDAQGRYKFVDLWPGDYYVAFTPPSNHIFVAANVGGNPAVDSDADPTTGRTAVTTLAPGESDLTWDAGVMQLGKLGDTVWFDSNQDGVVNEPLATFGLNGVQVNLYRLTGGTTNFVTSTLTSNKVSGSVTNRGYYLFSDLPPAIYMVKVVSGVPVTFTLAITHPEIIKYTIGYGTVNLTADFGFAKSGPPTAVTLKSFTASYAAGSVQVAWETAAELDNIGFNVYRSASPDGVRVKINPTLVPAVGGSLGSQYELVDQVPDRAVTYYYWLEDVTSRYETRVSGPAVLRGTAAISRKSLGGFVLPAGGLCRIRYAVMQAAGLPVTTLDPSQVQVFVGGNEVPCHVSGTGATMNEADSVLFYAPMSDEALECAIGVGPNALRMEVVAASPSREAGAVMTGLAGDGQQVDFLVTTNYIRYLLADFNAAPVWVMDITDPSHTRLMYGFSYVRGSNGLTAVYLSYPDVAAANCTAVGEQGVYDVPVIMKRP